MLRRLAAFALFCAPCILAQTNGAHGDLATLLGLTRPAQSNGLPGGWQGSATVEMNAGEPVLRITRTANSPGSSTPAVTRIPSDFAGQTLVLSGDLRAENVSGFASLWLRADNADGQSLTIDNGAAQAFRGTRDWHPFSVTIPNQPEARQLYFGVLLSGTGTVWARRLQLRVDGKPAAETPVIAPVQNALERDTEFADGSHIHLSTLTDAQVEDLATLGEIWGFLKYHHPAVTSGTRNWDAELFRILPKILATHTRTGRNATFLAWIETLGPLKPCAPCAHPIPVTQLSPDLAWLQDEHRFGKALSTTLLDIYSHRPTTAQFYVSKVPYTGNPSFDHERAYKSIPFPDSGYQLLTLFRWWNILEWWYPDRDLLPDLHATLRRYIRPMALATNQHDFTLTTMKLIGEAHDSHANLWSSLDQRPPIGPCRVDASLRFLGNQLVVWDNYSTTLQRGDLIDRIGDTTVHQFITDDLPFYTGSNEPARLRDLARSISDGACSAVDLHITRNGSPTTVHSTRVHNQPPGLFTHDRAGDALQMLSPDVAYLKLSSFHQKDVPAYLQQIAGTHFLILDIRNYPSEFAPYSLGGHFITAPTPFSRFTAPDLANPGAFSVTAKPAIQPLLPHYNGRIAILVDETSQSQAEFTTMAFRTAPNSIVVGSQTAGADGTFSQVLLPFAMSSWISGQGVFTPDGKQTQQVGITRDIEAIPTPAGIAAGRDEVLEVALHALLGPDVPQPIIERMAHR